MERSISTEIEIHASPEEVFDAWTDPGQVAIWWGEEGIYRVTHCEFDLREGGAWKSVGIGGNGSEFVLHGIYRKIDRPHFLSFTWNPGWDEAAADTMVELEFAATSDGTLLKLKHSGFAADKTRDSHVEGWACVFGWLRGYFEAKELSQ